jgi:hypothetical protein
MMNRSRGVEEKEMKQISCTDMHAIVYEHFLHLNEHLKHKTFLNTTILILKEFKWSKNKLSSEQSHNILQLVMIHFHWKFSFQKALYSWEIMWALEYVPLIISSKQDVHNNNNTKGSWIFRYK